jgi:hypothetical protein
MVCYQEKRTLCPSSKDPLGARSANVDGRQFGGGKLLSFLPMRWKSLGEVIKEELARSGTS